MQINGESMWDMEVWHALVSKIQLSWEDKKIMQLYKRGLDLTDTFTCLFNQPSNTLISGAGEIIIAAAYSIPCV